MLCLNGLNISLDRRESGSSIDFISHAHSDHASAAKGSNHVLASSQTIQLIEQAYGAEIEEAQNTAGIKLLDSGHMLGSRQLCVNDAGSNKDIVYTGDFQMQRSKTARPVEVMDADCLIMDSTYPDPEVVFDDRSEVEALMQDWVENTLKKGIALFSVYAMGKAQEVVALLNDLGITPVVSRKISKLNGVYKRNGIALEYASAYDEGSDFDDIVRGDFVGITETRDISGLASMLSKVHNKKVFTAVATGFAKVYKFGTDMQFPLSDHADFRQSIEYIEAASAKEVLTYGRNCEELAANLQKEGYDARPFSEYKRA
jgi:putative mRNA 3-end processing factor